MLNHTTLRATAALTIAAMLAGCATVPMNPNGVRQDASYPQGGTQAATDEDPCSVGTSRRPARPWGRCWARWRAARMAR